MWETCGQGVADRSVPRLIECPNKCVSPHVCLCIWVWLWTFFIFPQERARTSIDNISSSQDETSTNKSYEGIDNGTLALSKKFCPPVTGYYMKKSGRVLLTKRWAWSISLCWSFEMLQNESLEISFLRLRNKITLSSNLHNSHRLVGGTNARDAHTHNQEVGPTVVVMLCANFVCTCICLSTIIVHCVRFRGEEKLYSPENSLRVSNCGRNKLLLV